MDETLRTPQHRSRRRSHFPHQKDCCPCCRLGIRKAHNRIVSRTATAATATPAEPRGPSPGRGRGRRRGAGPPRCRPGRSAGARRGRPRRGPLLRRAVMMPHDSQKFPEFCKNVGGLVLGGTEADFCEFAAFASVHESEFAIHF